MFQTLNDVKQALQTHQIAALVTDTPTAQFISSSEIPGTEMVAQFPSTGEHYGLLFSKGNPLVDLREQGHRDAEEQRDAAARCRSSTCRSTSASRRSSPDRARGGHPVHQ